MQSERLFTKFRPGFCTTRTSMFNFSSSQCSVLNSTHKFYCYLHSRLVLAGKSSFTAIIITQMIRPLLDMAVPIDRDVIGSGLAIVQFGGILQPREGILLSDKLSVLPTLQEDFPRNPMYQNCSVEYATDVKICVNRSQPWQDLDIDLVKLLLDYQFQCLSNHLPILAVDTAVTKDCFHRG